MKDADLEPLDRLVLERAARLVADARAAFERFEFHTVSRRLLEFCTTDLSALWCDVKKDALYVLAPDDPIRRSAQTTALRLTEVVALLLQPLCPFTAEEIWENLPGRAGQALVLETYESLRPVRLSDEAFAAWERLDGHLRPAVQAQMEPLRRSGAVGSSAQAMVEIGPSAEFDTDLATCGLDLVRLAEALNVPEVSRNRPFEGAVVLPDWGGLAVLVRPAEGMKCPRCWQVRTDVEAGADGICARCRRVVGE